MPKNIKLEHVNRMFPFEFYNELSENLKEFVLLNPAFLLRDQMKISEEARKNLFQHARDNAPTQALTQNNIIEVEPFGELLTLEVCCPIDKKGAVIHDKEKRGQIPMCFIVAQLYDSSGAPVFAADVSEESIEQIPEVLWDDPNLMLGVVSFTEQDARVGAIRIPKRIEEKLFESVEPPSR